MSSSEEAAQELLCRAEELARAMEAGAHDALEEAFGARQAAFERLTALLGETVPDSLKPTLRDVAAQDGRFERAARQAQAAARGELEGIRRARDTARRLRPRGPEPRFVSRKA